MTSEFTELAIDCADPSRLAPSWCSVLRGTSQAGPATHWALTACNGAAKMVMLPGAVRQRA
jgi:hypothetical protein